MELPRPGTSAQVALPLERGFTTRDARARLLLQYHDVGLYRLHPPIVDLDAHGSAWYCLECGCTTYARVTATWVHTTSVRGHHPPGCRQVSDEPARCRCHLLPAGMTAGAGSVLWRRTGVRPPDDFGDEPVADDPSGAAVLCVSCGLEPTLLWLGRADGAGPLLGWYCADCAGISLPRQPRPADLAAARETLEYSVALGAAPPRIHAGF